MIEEKTTRLLNLYKINELRTYEKIRSKNIFFLIPCISCVLPIAYCTVTKYSYLLHTLGFLAKNTATVRSQYSSSTKHKLYINNILQGLCRVYI